MKELNRTRVDKFSIENSVKLSELDSSTEKEKYLISIEDLFNDCEKIELDERKIRLFLDGVKLTFKLENGIYRVYNNKKFVGLGIVKNELLKRDVIVWFVCMKSLK